MTTKLNIPTPFGKVDSDMLGSFPEDKEMKPMDIRDSIDSERQEPGCEYEDFKDQAISHLNNQ